MNRFVVTAIGIALTIQFLLGVSVGAAKDAILVTDLTAHRDPDDWFDVTLFLKVKGLNPRAIVVTDYLDERADFDLVKLQGLLGVDVPIARGKVKQSRETNLDMSTGAKLIVETLESAADRVLIISVGSLATEAEAYRHRPHLFRHKIERLYFVGGTQFGGPERNLNWDPEAAATIINSGIPLAWYPCDPDRRQKLSGKDEISLLSMGKVGRFLYGKIAVWRKLRPANWLLRTQQFSGQGKNLWSIPTILLAAEQLIPGTLIQTNRGRVLYDDLTKQMRFAPGSNWDDFRIEIANPSQTVPVLLNYLSSLSSAADR